MMDKTKCPNFLPSTPVDLESICSVAAHAKCLGAGKAIKAERDAKHAVKPWPGSHRGWGPITKEVD